MTHTDDGALVRYLDGECDAVEHDTVAMHVGQCATCATRLDELDDRSQRLRVALTAWDADARRARRRIPTWLRAAAVIVVLLGVAGGVRPVRAWILDGAQAIWTAVMGTDEIAGDTPVEGTPGATPSATVAFTLSGDLFVLEMASRQAGGALRITAAERTMAEARILGGTGAEDLVVLPTGLRIVNRASSEASYEIRLPNTLAAVRVVVAGERPLTLEPAGDSTLWEIDVVERQTPVP